MRLCCNANVPWCTPHFVWSIYYTPRCDQFGCQDKFYEFSSAYNHLHGKQFASAHSSLHTAASSEWQRRHIAGELLIVFCIFNPAGSRFICKTALIISSSEKKLDKRALLLAASLFHVTLFGVLFGSPWLQTEKQRLQQLWLGKMFIGKWCFLRRKQTARRDRCSIRGKLICFLL